MYCGMRLVDHARLSFLREFEKRPCGIVAQKIFFVRKSSREKFSRFSFGTLSIIAVKYREYNCRERGATRRDSEEKFASHERDAPANPAKVFLCDPSHSKSADRKEPLHFQSHADLAGIDPSFGFALRRVPHLYLSFAHTLSSQLGARIFHAEAYIPTQPAQAEQEARLPRAHEDPGRPEGTFAPPRQGAQAGQR